MKAMAIVALCFLSSFASANSLEEVVVKARQVKIVVDWKLSDKHKQNPVTKDWYYVEEKEKKERKA